MATFVLMFLKRLLYYVNPANLFRKTKTDINTRMMHGINTVFDLGFPRFAL